MCVSVCAQDMGQDIEPYFQEVVASLEQNVEEGTRTEGGQLKDRLEQLYKEILTASSLGTVQSIYCGQILYCTTLHCTI